MKKVLLLIILFSATSFPQKVKITDYEVPISKAKTLRFDGNWNWSQVGDEVTSNTANGNLIFHTFYSSLPLAWFFNVDASGGKSFDTYTHNINADASIQKYVWNERDLFAFSEIKGEHSTNYNQVKSDFTVGFGYGRFIDATALAKAVRIEDHLLKDEVITSFLPKETMIKIANIIERQDEYRDEFGTTYETEWFNDIENEIEKSGVVEGESIGAIGILRMRQVLFGVNERVNQRSYGWDIKLGVLFPLTSAFDSVKTGNPNLSIGGRYSIPISWQFQLNTAATFSTPLDSSFTKQNNFDFRIELIYELSNRINFVSNYSITLTKQPLKSTSVNHNLNASFWYYLENNIYLTINGSFTKQPDNPRVLTTSIGLQYNLF